MELFANNPFKVDLIQRKALGCASSRKESGGKLVAVIAQVTPGTMTTAYRCGDLVDLCRGRAHPEREREKLSLMRNPKMKCPRQLSGTKSSVELCEGVPETCSLLQNRFYSCCWSPSFSLPLTESLVPNSLRPHLPSTARVKAFKAMWSQRSQGFKRGVGLKFEPRGAASGFLNRQVLSCDSSCSQLSRKVREFTGSLHQGLRSLLGKV